MPGEQIVVLVLLLLLGATAVGIARQCAITTLRA